MTRDDISVTELSTGLIYGSYTGPIACCAYGQGNRSNQANERFSMSYITGSHAFKTGLFLLQGYHDQFQEVNGAIAYTFRNQVPDSLTQYAVPYRASERLKNLGLYAQDQWTVRKLTLNLGLRFDYFNGYNLDQDVEAGLYVDARHFDRVDNVPNWKDVSPRIGAAYDLFGNGKTAVKASIGRYVSSQGVGIAEANNPAQATVISATRTWTDVNGNYIPDCAIRNLAANGECGPVSNNRFGTVNFTRRYSQDVLNGFGVRPFNWQALATLQHELRPGMALNVGYFRTWFRNFGSGPSATDVIADNLAVTPADFDPFLRFSG